MKHYSSLTSVVKHQVIVETLCSQCNESVTMDKEQIVTTIAVPNARKGIKMDKSINEWVPCYVALVTFHSRFVKR